MFPCRHLASFFEKNGKNLPDQTAYCSTVYAVVYLNFDCQIDFSSGCSSVTFSLGIRNKVSVLTNNSEIFADVKIAVAYNLNLTKYFNES